MKRSADVIDEIHIDKMLLYFLALIIGAEGLPCKAKGPCGCELDDGSGYFDLSPMMKYGMSPMFVGVDMKEGVFVFSVDLCQKFTCLNNKDSLICASSTILGAKIIGDTLKDFDVDDDKTVFIYTAQDQGQTITTRVTMHCSQNQGIGSLSNFESSGSQAFATTLTSQHACWHRGSGGGGGNKKKGLSTGSIMCIILLVLVVVYLVGGILINKYVRKIEDESLVPNVEFWKALPGYIKNVINEIYENKMLLFFLALIVGAEGKLECKAKGPCGCELDDGSGYIDLSPMKNYGKSPMFLAVQMQGGIFSFSVDLCQKFKCVSNGDALICATSAMQQTAVTANTLSKFDVNPDKTIVFIYTDTTQGETLTTRITIHCSQDQGIGSLSTFESADQKLFTTTLTSQHACLHGGNGGGGNKNKGLSTGSILCIILLLLVVVYLVGGILINKYVRKIEDESFVPNVEFWKALPGYIKDGCQFSFSKVTRSKEYEQI